MVNSSVSIGAATATGSESPLPILNPDIAISRWRGFIVATRSFSAAASACFIKVDICVSTCSIPAWTAAEPTDSILPNWSIINSRVRL